VRQEARFGCCICGLPIYEYHHIVPHAAGGPDSTENLMLLCPNHHTLATQGGLPEEDQRRHKRSPYNVEHGYTLGLLAVTQSTCVVDVGGGVLLAGEIAMIVIDGDPLLSVKRADDGRLLLSATLYDENDELIAEIVDNEWIAGNPQPWDIESTFRRLKLNLAPRAVALRVDARGEPITLRGSLWRHGAQARMHAGAFEMSGVVFKDLGVVNHELHTDTCSREGKMIPRAGGGAHRVGARPA
jgi:hypothetical protein